jgi:guanylate kinase
MTATPGSLFIVSAPSGAGKTSLVRAILQSGIDLDLSISYTTRVARSGEVDGRDYHFVSLENFEEMRRNDEFLESAQVYGNYYGTSKKWINEAIGSGRDVLLEIDSQGAQQVRQAFPQAISLFVLPPSLEVLELRLRSRGQDSLEAIGRRLASACEEVTHVSEYDYVIINETLDRALYDLRCIVQAERLRLAKQLVRHCDLLEQFGSVPDHSHIRL